MDLMKSVLVANDLVILPSILGSSTAASPNPSNAYVKMLAWTKIVDLTGTPFEQIDSKAWQMFSQRLMEGTAGAHLVFVGHNRPAQDSRTILAAEWAPKESERRANVELRVRRLVTVKAAFGLSASDLARVCCVSRTQLYKWLSRDEKLHLSPANWQRLSDLARIAEDWNALSSAPARDVLSEKVRGEKTLLSLLSAAQLDHRAIRSAMKKLAQAVSTRPLRRDQKLREAGIKPRPLLGQLPQDE
jgi:hypothetical protein